MLNMTLVILRMTPVMLRMTPVSFNVTVVLRLTRGRLSVRNSLFLREKEPSAWGQAARSAA